MVAEGFELDQIAIHTLTPKGGHRMDAFKNDTMPELMERKREVYKILAEPIQSVRFISCQPIECGREIIPN